MTSSWLRRRPFIVCAAALAVANAPFWLLGHAFFMSRAMVNVDLALALATLCVWPWLGSILLALAWATDLVVSQSLTFHFGTPVEFLRSFRFAAALRIDDFLHWSQLLLALPFAIGAVALRILVVRKRSLWPYMLALAAALVLFDTVNGSSQLSDRSTWRMPYNVAGSPTSNLLTLQARGDQPGELRAVPVAETAQGLIDIPQWAAAHPGRGIMLVIVESLGAPVEAELRQWLDERMIDDSIEQGFRAVSTDLPFRGSTTAGELRTLCALLGSYRGLDATTGATCLPSRLRQLGWTTIGLHGFSRRMFDRETWWPGIGLQESHFIDSPSFGKGPLCGSTFRGACDETLLGIAARRLEEGNRFVYALTLNTHLPLVPTTVPPDLGDICRKTATPQEVCELVAALGTVLHRTRELATQVRPAPLLLVLGDHAPPFALRTSRALFQQGLVPAYILIPRE